MTQLLAALNLVAATTTKKTSGSSFFLIVLVVIAVAGYFFFLKPQQRKAAAARANQGSGYAVGDEVQTIGGVVGTILEIHGDRYTLLTGSTSGDGNLNGPQPTRIVFVRQAIARKLEPIVDVDPGAAGRTGHHDVEIEDHDVEDHDVDGHDEEAEEA
jgi:preprotein translocase subunit YajC